MHKQYTTIRLDAVGTRTCIYLRGEKLCDTCSRHCILCEELVDSLPNEVF